VAELSLHQLLDEMEKLSDVMSSVMKRLALPFHRRVLLEHKLDFKHYRPLDDAFRRYSERLDEYGIKLDSLLDGVRGPSFFEYNGDKFIKARVFAPDKNKVSEGEMLFRDFLFPCQPMKDLPTKEGWTIVNNFSEFRQQALKYMENHGGIPTKPDMVLTGSLRKELPVIDDLINKIPSRLSQTEQTGILGGVKDALGIKPSVPSTSSVRSIPRSPRPTTSTPSSSASGGSYFSSRAFAPTAALMELPEGADFTTRTLHSVMKDWTKGSKICFSLLTGVSCAALIGYGVHSLTSHEGEEGPNAKKVRMKHLCIGSAEIAAGLIFLLVTKKTHDLIR
jgi:hypothetical protein